MRVAIDLCFAVCALGACGSSAATPKKDAAIDAGPTFDASCYAAPEPNENDQIINACTTAQKIYLTPVLPLVLPDGGLPPLPSPP